MTLRGLMAFAAIGAALVQVVTAQPLAFPGAEGFGRHAVGGRGGEVYYVTNLHDAGPGSFRDAVSKPHRTVLFDVGGVIRITNRIVVAPRITIAGQTAPGDGIAVYGNGVSFTDADEAIVRYVRFRMGVGGDSGKDAITIARGRNMIFDHVSVSWGRDENFSISGSVSNITIQDCIIGQGLQHHSAGGLIQTPGGVSILRTLYIDNHTRNPKVKGANQFVNNVVYNWGPGGAYILGDSAGPSWANVKNNYFIAGPDTGARPFSRGNTNFQIYAMGNFFDATKDGILNGSEVARADYGIVTWRDEPFDYPVINAVPAQQAVRIVLAQSGASLRRDAVDGRLMQELASYGRLGQIITNEFDAPMPSAMSLAGGDAPVDTDRDGMPDVWESDHELNPSDARDRNDTNSEGHTRLEEYLNSLVSSAPALMR